MKKKWRYERANNSKKQTTVSVWIKSAYTAAVVEDSTRKMIGINRNRYVFFKTCGYFSAGERKETYLEKLYVSDQATKGNNAV